MFTCLFVCPFITLFSWERFIDFFWNFPWWLVVKNTQKWQSRILKNILTQAQAPTLAYFEHKNKHFSKYLKNASLDFFFLLCMILEPHERLKLPSCHISKNSRLWVARGWWSIFFPDMDQFGLASSSVQLIWVED